MTRKRTPILTAVAFAALVAGLVWLAAAGLMRGSLLVEARINYSEGEPQPIAMAPIYLLDADMLKLAQGGEGRMSPLEERVFRENPDLGHLAGVMNARRREAYSLGPDVVPLMEKSRPLWEPHVRQRVQTNAGGRASFSDLKPGEYWLVCRSETRDGGVAFWNLPVTVKRGENRIALDARNALQCSSCKY